MVVAATPANPIDTAPSSARRWVDPLLSLQFKATVLVVVLTLLVTAAVAGYLLQSSGKLAREQHDAQMVTAADLLAKAAGAIIAAGKPEELKALAVESANGHPLLYVIVSDADGKQLAVAEHRNVHVLQSLQRNESERVPVPGTPVFHSQNKRTPLFLDVVYPITDLGETDDEGTFRPGRLLGYVRTGMIADQWKQSMASRLDLVIGVGILATVAAIPLGFLLVRKIVAPLDGLADVMHRFSQGKLDARSSVNRSDEIGKLAAAFNRMADQQQHSHQRIVRLNAELEERVAVRTQQLRELASREPLTGLYNRRHFNETLERRFSEAARYGTDLTCIMIDLDEFKAANDTLGHQTGDEILVMTAGTIVGQLRSADIAARFGGDEFVILLPQTNSDQARILAERIMERFSREVGQRYPQTRVSMSMGIGSLQMLEPKDAEALLRLADQALYDAKAAGKHQIVTALPAAKAVPA
jgi:diguanylate cyclase (GGDEF)-like protein